MTEEKKKVGRPRKYESRAARQKAYLERKKQKMIDLEEQIKQLEKEKMFSTDLKFEGKEVSFKEIEKFSWKKITPSEIALMGTRELEGLVEKFKDQVQQFTSFRKAIENITLGIIRKNQLVASDESSKEKIKEITKQIDKDISNLDERMQQQTFLYLMEAELANRLRLEGRKSKIDLFEESIGKLEKETIKKEKIKKAQ